MKKNPEYDINFSFFKAIEITRMKRMFLKSQNRENIRCKLNRKKGRKIYCT